MGDVPFSFIAILVVGLVALIVVAMVLLKSIHNIAPDRVGVVVKKFGSPLTDGALIAMNNEAGYQPELLQPGWRLKIWPFYTVEVFPRVQIPTDGVGLVIAQIGDPLPSGAKSAVYKTEFGDFEDLQSFVANGGQRGVQRKVLQPGTVAVIHPIAFVVLTKGHMFGRPLSDEVNAIKSEYDRSANVDDGRRRSSYDGMERDAQFEVDTPQLRRLSSHPLEVVFIPSNMIGVVTTLDGPSSTDRANRLGGYDDIVSLHDQEQEGANVDAQLIERLLEVPETVHDSYQDYQAFLDAGGRSGLQHDVLYPGRYVFNPHLVSVQLANQVTVEQGEVAVIKAYVGLPMRDTTGEEYRYGSIVPPGCRGVWSVPLETGQYAINPVAYGVMKVQTSILTLNWADAVSEAHQLDRSLSPISAQTQESFPFSIDLVVQIHVPYTMAPRVIMMVGNMANLVKEVLQAAVGNYFRNALQQLAAVEFIAERERVQTEAQTYIEDYLGRYYVEVPGVYIQDVRFPEALVEVLRDREIAKQQQETFASQQAAEQSRVALEAQRGEADMQVELARARVSVTINEQEAQAAIAKAEGEATVTTKTGEAQASRIRAIGTAEAETERAAGLAKAEGYEAQQRALGANQTTFVAVMEAAARGNLSIVPTTMVSGNGGGSGGLFDLLMTQMVTSNGHGSSNGNGSEPTPTTDTTTREESFTIDHSTP